MMAIYCSCLELNMATAVTGSFRLTETVSIATGQASGTRSMGTLDLSSYVSVPSGMAIAVEQVDFIWQVGADYAGTASQAVGGDASLNAQLTDLNPGTLFVRADDHSLIASQHIDIDHTNNVTTAQQDLFPDNFGPAGLSESFMVVNSELYLTIGNDGSATADALFCTAVVKARIVKMSNSDWVALAIQSTAN